MNCKYCGKEVTKDKFCCIDYISNELREVTTKEIDFTKAYEPPQTIKVSEEVYLKLKEECKPGVYNYNVVYNIPMVSIQIDIGK